MAIIDRIKFDGTTGNSWIVYKHPSDQLVLGSQLIVNEGQEAVFVKGGEAADTFTPGTHALHTGNLPILKNLVNLPFGGNTPFSAEVYFINKTSKLDMLWGTTTPIPVEDPKYGLIINFSAHGSYGISVEDARLVVIELIGAMPAGSATDFQMVKNYFNSMINTRVKNVIARFLKDKQLSFLDVTAYLDELSMLAERAVYDEFDRFGIRVKNFFIDTLIPPKEEYARLQKKKEELALGQEFYFKDRSYDILEGAANNGAGGIAAAGVGLGMGVGMVPPFAQFTNTVMQQANIAAHTGQQMTCPKCGNPSSVGSVFCSSCGNALTANVCPKCGAAVTPASNFCNSCGQPMAKKCANCGADCPASATFCNSCGKQL